MHPVPRLFGRTRETGLLEHRLDTVRGGESAVLVVRGEPGIGKTALLQHLIAAAAGFRVIREVSVPAERNLAFAGLHHFCAPLLGRWPELAEPQRRALGIAFGLVPGDPPDRFMVALAALDLLARTAQEEPLLCVLDDAQWLDPASAQVLGFVGRRLSVPAIGLVLATRTPTAGPDHRAGPDHLAGLDELRLTGLDEVATRALLATVTTGPLDENLGDRIVAESHGNPRTLLELYRGLGAAERAGGFAVPDSPRSIEPRYRKRLRQLPDPGRRLVLLAAADALGDPALLVRAARLRGLDAGAVRMAVHAGLLDVGTRVRFRDPRLRSAVYRASSSADRRAAHQALAAATDPLRDPDRRSWHRAHAATGPDEAVAADLIRSADRARRQGRAAVAAALSELAVTLTPEPGVRAVRALSAAETACLVGDFDTAQVLLLTAEIGPLDELHQAQAERLRAQIAFVLRREKDAPGLLWRAAARLRPLDPDLARQTRLEALIAVIHAGRLGNRSELEEFAADPEPGEPAGLLPGLAERLIGGNPAPLREALRRHRGRPAALDWAGIAGILVAMDLGDDEAWLELATDRVRLARADGAFRWLPSALNQLALHQIHAGEPDRAEATLAEGERLDPGVRAVSLPYAALVRAGWRGDASTVAGLSEVMVQGASSRGEGAALTWLEYTEAVLHNGAGDYRLAAEAAGRAAAAQELAVSPWALSELVEAAVRCGQRARAVDAAEALAERADTGDWACGSALRSLALVSEGRTAEERYREAIGRLSRTRMAAHLARARLVYGEWLRRENRRAEARDQLRAAFDALAAMGAEGFAERARRELRATGVKVARRDGSAAGALTAQEEEIAQLARRGRTNPEIGAQLFLSARTVEWHLRKAFAKLQITSRRDLDVALRRRPTDPVTGRAGGP